MNPLKLKLLEELLEHISGSQGNDLKSLLDESKKPQVEEEVSDSSDPLSEVPKGLSGEKVEVLEKPEGESKGPSLPSDQDMSEDELKELIEQYLSS